MQPYTIFHANGRQQMSHRAGGSHHSITVTKYLAKSTHRGKNISAHDLQRLSCLSTDYIALLPEARNDIIIIEVC